MTLPATSDTGSGKPRGSNVVLWSVAGLIIGLLIGHVVTYHMRRHHPPAFTTQYQAVLLTNGAVYYGKLSGYGTRNPTMDDVFYIVSKTDPETKQVSNVLVKRGKELHGPDKMYLNPNQIVFVESVGPDSKVAQLIKSSGQ
ncbi:MAG TPA: hypothetical protein VMD98_11945 [Bryocella sp.]|nr:hypothetical protein [Bryocella sp.]